MKRLCGFITFLFLIQSGLSTAQEQGQGFQVESAAKLQTLSSNNTFIIRGRSEVKTFGQVTFVIDLAGARDGKRELEIRRKRLTLADGRPVTSVGYDLKSGIIIGSAGPVDRISVAGVEQTAKGRQVLAIFYDKNNQVMAPSPADLIVFDVNYNTLAVDYTPLVGAPAAGLDVSILIDSSGSMVLAMKDALAATSSFLANLPDFTRCQIITFGQEVRHLTPENPNELPACADSGKYLKPGITAFGGTALSAALQEGFSRTASSGLETPKLVLVVTDGINTVDSGVSHEELAELKDKNNIRSFVFWTGNHDPEHLKGLADYELAATTNIAQELESFLQTIGVSVSGMQTLRINESR